MKRLNQQNLVYSATLFFLLLIANTSCSDNASDEMPNKLNSAFVESRTTNQDQALGDVNIKTIGKIIPHETAKRWIENHSQKTPDGVKYHLFGKDIFDRLLNQPTAVGMRLSYALDDAGNPVIVMVAVDKNNVPLNGPNEAGEADASFPCPPYCNAADN